MSISNVNRAHPISGVDFKALDTTQTTALFHKALKEGIHGFCYSAYGEGQKPGHQLERSDIERRLKILKPYSDWVRSFSCTEGNELIPGVAKSLGMKTLVGAWLSDDREKNETEIEGLITAGQAGHVDIAAVGNEVLYREDLPVSELLEYMRRVKEALPEITMGYVDAYYHFTQHPEVTDACDVVLANCYPYWEACPFEHSLVYMKQMYAQAKQAAGDKPVIITETGWPSAGTPLKGSHPSANNAMGYFINAQQWAKQRDIPLFYFSSFDEGWKVGDEGDVGAHWGVWADDESLKY